MSPVPWCGARPVTAASAGLFLLLLSFARPACASTIADGALLAGECIAAGISADAPVTADSAVTANSAARPEGGLAPATGAEAETTIVIRLPRSRAFEATLLSLAATVGPIAYLYSNAEALDEFDWPILAAFAGIMAGPAVGYVYGGDPLRGLAGVGIRTLLLVVSAHSGYTAAVLIPISSLYDIVRLPANLDRNDRRHALRLQTVGLRTSPAQALALTVDF